MGEAPLGPSVDCESLHMKDESNVNTDRYVIALFDSTSAVLFAEGLLKEAGILYAVIPVPRHLSSDCGVCLRFPRDEHERVESLLAGRMSDYEIIAL